jgi:hypothetical protein
LEIFGLRQSFDEIAKFACALPLRHVLFPPFTDCSREGAAIRAQLRQTRVDFREMFFSKLD